MGGGTQICHLREETPRGDGGFYPPIHPMCVEIPHNQVVQRVLSCWDLRRVTCAATTPWKGVSERGSSCFVHHLSSLAEVGWISLFLLPFSGNLVCFLYEVIWKGEGSFLVLPDHITVEKLWSTAIFGLLFMAWGISLLLFFPSSRREAGGCCRASAHHCASLRPAPEPDLVWPSAFLLAIEET